MVEWQNDADACIVCVRVNDIIVGTGFVVGEGRVVTCAHVVCGEGTIRREGTISIEFYAVTRAAADAQNKNNAGSVAQPTSAAGELPKSPRQIVQIDEKHFSPKDQADVAVLVWEGKLPPEVKPARLSFQENLNDRAVKTRGYTRIEPFDSHPALGVILASTQTKAGFKCWQFRSQEITDGYSGAPLFDSNTGLVLGMVSQNAIPDPIQLRNIETAFAISCQTLCRVYPELKQLSDDAELERKHAEILERLKEEMRRILVGNDTVLSTLAKELGYTGSGHDSDGRARQVVDLLVNLPLYDAIVQLLQLDKRFRSDENMSAVKVMSDLYLALVPAVLEPKLVKTLRAEIWRDNRCDLVIPASSRTIVALVMAGVDGRVGRFRPLTKKGSPPVGSQEVPPLPERGISRPGIQHFDSLTQALLDALELSLEDQRDPKTLLKAVLEQMAMTGERVYIIVADHQSKMDPAARRQIEASYPYLHHVEMTTPTDDVDQHHASVVAPFLRGNFLPPGDSKR
ncbi:MAG: serine protease [Planctomycetota bacterium]|nr:serine protease [Planctomycetota bacterium]